MLNPFQSTLLVIFGVVAYMMWVDENVATYVNLTFKIMKVNVGRIWWMIRFHPQNPITNLIMRWKYDRIARELQREMERKED